MLKQRIALDPKRSMGEICIAYSEVLDGRRGSEQIARWLTEACYNELNARSTELAAKRRQEKKTVSREFFRFRKAGLFPTCKNCIEGVVVMESKTGIRTLAVKMQPINGKWRVTEIRVF